MAKKLYNPARTYPDIVHDLRCNITNFESKITKGPGCWSWSGPRHRQGYGMFSAWRIADGEGIMVTAHRLSYRIYVGPITDPNIIHKCMNLDCTNPAHLTTGTQKDVGEMNVKLGRTPMVKGVKRGPYLHKQLNRAYKYSTDQIQWMRTATIDEMVEEYDITRERASRLRHASRVGYKWLPFDASSVTKDPRGRKRKE